jgi:hypothetical protein
MMAENVGVKIGKLETRMDRVEEGVANFRAFQVDARDFFTRSDERALVEQRFRDKRDEEIKEAAKGAAAEVKLVLDERHFKADRSDRLWKRGMAIAMLIVVTCGVWIAYREYERKIATLTIPAPITHTSQPRQDTTIPQSYNQQGVAP